MRMLFRGITVIAMLAMAGDAFTAEQGEIIPSSAVTSPVIAQQQLGDVAKQIEQVSAELTARESPSER